MKPTKAIVATNNNVMYYPFWNVVSKFWNKVIGIEPVLIFVGKENPNVLNLSDEYGEVFHFNPSDHELSYSTVTMAQVIRHFGATKYPNEICILSDADMLPLKKEYYFNENTLNFDDQGVCFYSSDWPAPNRYPMCYIAAKGSVFEEIIGAHYDDFPEVIGKWIECGHGWDTDELIFYDKWKNSKYKDNSLFLKRGWNRANIANNRIDRVFLQNFDPTRLDQYYDYHMERPYFKSKKHINLLCEHYGV